MSDILFIREEDLADPRAVEFLETHENSHLYWTPSWSPSFYARLAYHGCIATAWENEGGQWIMLPEMQKEYALLDWENLRLPRSAGKLLNVPPSEACRLTVDRCFSRVSEEVRAYHDPCWLCPNYVRMLQALREDAAARFCRPLSVELWGPGGELLAGELGYRIGRTYTSLSGFCRREVKGAGTLQMVLLGTYLRNRGMDFWNLGHCGMPYKTRLGARELSRSAFLKRWKGSRSRRAPSLAGELSPAERRGISEAIGLGS